VDARKVTRRPRRRPRETPRAEALASALGSSVLPLRSSRRGSDVGSGVSSGTRCFRRFICLLRAGEDVARTFSAGAQLNKTPVALGVGTTPSSLTVSVAEYFCNLHRYVPVVVRPVWLHTFPDGDRVMSTP